VHSTKISQWQRQVRAKDKELFVPAHLAGEDAAVAQAKLYEEVVRLKMKWDWEKKYRLLRLR
jgi:hypothetical protein